MQVGSLVETVSDFDDVKKVWDVKYPDKGDILTIRNITDHHNDKCKAAGIMLLEFEELPNTPGLCDKQIDGTPNFVELLPPFPEDYMEPEPKKVKAPKKLELETV